MRYLLAVFLAFNVSTAFAHGTGLEDLLVVNFDKSIATTVEVCEKRDPESGPAVAQAWNAWTSAHAKELDELHRGRDRYNAWVKAQAFDPKSKMDMNEREFSAGGLDMLFVMVAFDGFKKLAEQRDAEVAQTCKQMISAFKDGFTDEPLHMALDATRKLLAGIDKKK